MRTRRLLPVLALSLVLLPIWTVPAEALDQQLPTGYDVSVSADKTNLTAAIPYSQSFCLEFKVKNTGFMWDDYTIEVNAPMDAPFLATVEPSELDNVLSQEVEKCELKVDFAPTIPQKIEPGSRFLVDVLVKSKTKTDVQDGQRFNVTVDFPKVEIEKFSISDKRPGMGETIDIRFELRNTGSIDLRNCTVLVLLGGDRIYGKTVDVEANDTFSAHKRVKVENEGPATVELSVTTGTGDGKEIEFASREEEMFVEGGSSIYGLGFYLGLAVLIIILVAIVVHMILKRRRKPE